MESTDLNILVVTQDATLLNLLESLKKKRKGHKIFVAGNLNDFFNCLLKGNIDLMIFDPDIESLSPWASFSLAKSYHQDIPAILVFDNEDYETIGSTLGKGLVYRMLKPAKNEEFEEVCNTIRELRNSRVGGAT